MGLHTRRAGAQGERLLGRGAGGLAAVGLTIAAIAMGCASGQETSSSGDDSGSGWDYDSGTGITSSSGSGGSTSSGGWNLPDSGTVEPGRDAGAIDASVDSGTVPPWTPDASVSVTCSPIVNGTSSLVVNGTTRKFEVQLPANTTANTALLFVWHGWNQQASAFASQVVYDVPSGKWVPFDPNAFPMPLVIVAPDDTGLFVVGPAGNVGLDWDIEPEKPPVDFPFFEAMLQCIEQQFTIDATRIYSFGFSAGAVFTDLLSAEYPHLFAATISESGAWFNDPAEQQQVLVNNAIPFVKWDWPAFVPADKGNVLLSHGGSNDFATIISLENANQEALPFLHANQRTVVECVHNFGHTLDPDLTQSMYYDYLWAHQLGGPPLTALPSSFPTQAAPVGATSCYYHSAQ